MSEPIEFIPARWSAVFDELVSSVADNLFLVSPFISAGPVEKMVRILHNRGLPKSVSIRVVTDLSPNNILRGSTDPAALLYLANEISRTTVTYLPSVHAKVYLADESMGIVTSGNLTDGGLYRNYEYGIRLNDPLLIRAVREDLSGYANLGNIVPKPYLETLVHAASDLHQIQRAIEREASHEIRREFSRRIASTKEDLMRIRAAGQSDNAIFSATLIYLLKKYGPMTTVQIQPLVQQIHPDLCDDRTDRIINGVHFGKRWKHMVRNAQQSLKKDRIIGLRGMKWELIN